MPSRTIRDSERNRRRGVHRPAEQQQDSPAETADQRARAKPRPALLARHGGEAADGQREVGGEQGDVGGARPDQRRRGKAAHQPEDRAWRAEAERQAERGGGDQRHADEGGARPDQVVEIGRDQDRGIESGDARAGERLADPGIADEAFAAQCRFRRDDQSGAEHQPHDHPHDRRQQAGIDRIFDDQETGDGKRDPARPDRQSAPEQFLEAEARPWPGLVRLILLGFDLVDWSVNRFGRYIFVLDNRLSHRRRRRLLDDDGRCTNRSGLRPRLLIIRLVDFVSEYGRSAFEQIDAGAQLGNLAPQDDARGQQGQYQQVNHATPRSVMMVL